MIGRLGHRFSSNWCGRGWRLRLRLLKNWRNRAHVHMNIVRTSARPVENQPEISHPFRCAHRIYRVPRVTLNHPIRTFTRESETLKSSAAEFYVGRQ